MSEFIRPNSVFPLRFNDGENAHEFLLGAEYDRIVHYPKFGAYILKIVDEEQGFVQAAMDKETAEAIADRLGSPIDEREWMTEREHNLHLSHLERNMERDFADQFKDLDLNFPEEQDEPRD